MWTSMVGPLNVSPIFLHPPTMMVARTNNVAILFRMTNLLVKDTILVKQNLAVALDQEL